jgi:mitogen-activated protein kinase kinase
MGASAGFQAVGGAARPMPLSLRLPSLGGLNTQLGSSPGMRPARPQISLQPLQATSSGSGSNVSGDVFEHPYLDPTSSAGSSVSQLHDSALTGSTTGSPGPKDIDPEQDMKELQEHLSKLSLSLQGRDLDAGDLDNEGWRAVSQLDRIEMLGGLGEGAGGAVTRCTLKGGNTVFALKVRHAYPLICLLTVPRSLPPTQTPM